MNGAVNGSSRTRQLSRPFTPPYSRLPIHTVEARRVVQRVERLALVGRRQVEPRPPRPDPVHWYPASSVYSVKKCLIDNL